MGKNDDETKEYTANDVYLRVGELSGEFKGVIREVANLRKAVDGFHCLKEAEIGNIAEAVRSNKDEIDAMDSIVDQGKGSLGTLKIVFIVIAWLFSMAITAVGAGLFVELRGRSLPEDPQKSSSSETGAKATSLNEGSP